MYSASWILLKDTFLTIFKVSNDTGTSKELKKPRKNKLLGSIWGTHIRHNFWVIFAVIVLNIKTVA